MNHNTNRYHELDALRGFAMLLGIVLHGLLSFTFVPIWPAQDIHQNDTVYGLFLHAIHGFRMPVFFLISGFFTAMMWRKQGAKGLVVHRAKRILLPLIIGTIVIWPMMLALGYWGTLAKEKHAGKQSASSDIWTATKEGNLDGLRQLIEEGADVNGRDPFRVSPLEWSAMYDHPEAIALLIENGAGVNDRNQDGSTALHAAAFFGRTKAVQELIRLGADTGVKNKNGHTPLQAARLDMGIVHFIAGILQMQIDSQTVAAGRRETAAYLDQLRARPDGKDGLSGAAKEGGQDVDRQASDQRPDTDSALYFALTFFPVFHYLWFLYYLLWLVVFFLIAVRVRRWIPLRAPSWMISTPWCFLWLVPLTLLPQLFMTQTFGVDTAAGLFPWPPKLIYYTIFFGFGALCFGRPEFEVRSGRHWVLMLLAALLILLIGIHFFEENDGRVTAHVIISLCAVVYAWLMVFGLIGLFRRFFARENKRIRYLSDSSYWLYLAHLPLIIGLQVWVSNWDIHHLPKFFLVCALTFAILIILYEHAIRYTFVGTALNGKKTRPARLHGD